jgi:hypothetical protein
MTVLSARQVAGYWQGAGGPASRDVEWVAIAMGESSLDDSAVSPAGAIGLWQIMPFHAGQFGITVDSLFQPATNALVAVTLSGNGTNCAAWDSCYRNIYASGRYAFLAFPEVGSADYNNLPIAASELGKNVPAITGTGPPPVDTHDYETALQHSNYMTGRWAPGQSRGMQRERTVIDRMFTRGWRP